MDNYANHKTAKECAWLARRPHYHVHFTPTSASWINQVERWFAELTRKQLQRGIHRSMSQLEADILTFIDRHNESPKPYRWTKSADEILASIMPFCQKMDHTLRRKPQLRRRKTRESFKNRVGDTPPFCLFKMAPRPPMMAQLRGHRLGASALTQPFD